MNRWGRKCPDCGFLLRRTDSKTVTCLHCLRLRRRRIEEKKSRYFSLAHAYVAAAVTYGDLPDLTHGNVKCSRCGERTAFHYDHRDYKKPLEVKPVCRECNDALGPGKNGIIRMRSIVDEPGAIAVGAFQE